MTQRPDKANQLKLFISWMSFYSIQVSGNGNKDNRNKKAYEKHLGKTCE